MMRVCVLLPVLDAYKGANHLPLLAALPDVEFTILTSRTRPSGPALPPNVAVETLGGRLGFYEYGCSDFLFARAVMRRYPPAHAFWKKFDVLHINQAMGPALLRLRGTGIPICFFIHHPVSADLQTALEESRGLERLRWRAKYALLIRWQRKFCRTLPHVATVSRTSADRIAADYGCDRGKVHLVPNGVDGTLFTQGSSDADFDVGAVGSFVHPRKGFRYLAEAYRRLTAQGLRAADVGRRTDEQRAVLAAIPGVRVFGTVPEEELIRCMQRCAALLSTSLYEGFGLSIIEALACGRPAFAFGGGAVPEILAPIDPSLVVPPRDVSALVARVTKFLRLPMEEKRQRGERYRAAVLERYSLARSAVALRALYERLRA